MPVNKTLLTQHLDGLRNLPTTHTVESLQNQISRSYKTLEKVSLGTPTPVHLMGFETRDELLAARLNAMPPRHERFKVMNSLARLHQQASALTDEDEPSLNGIHEAHQKLADQIEWVASQDKEGAMTYVPFAESFEGQDSIDEVLRNYPDPDEARARIRQLQSDQIVDFIKWQFPAGSEPTALTRRETFVLGKDIWSVGEQLSSGGDSNEITAQVFEELLSEGRITTGDEQDKAVRTAKYWAMVSDHGFDAFFDSALTPDIISHRQLEDRLPALNAVALANQMIKNLDLRNIELSYHDARNNDDPALTNLTEYTPGLTHIVVTGDPTGSGMPIVATQRDPAAPSYIAVTAPGKGHQVVQMPDDADTDARLNVIKRAAETLPPRTNFLQVQKSLDQIKQQWYDLPVDDPDALSKDLKGIQKAIGKIAQHLPAPGYGTPEQETVTADLVKLNLLLGRDHNGTALQFSAPMGMNTFPNQTPPDRLVDRCDNSDGTTDVVFSKVLPTGQGDPATAETLRGIANSDVKQTIASTARSRGWSLGTDAPGLPGLSVYASAHDDKSPGNVFVGHWMASKDLQKLTNHTVVGLLHRNAKGEPLFHNPNLGDPLRSPEDAETMRYATVNLMHSADTPVELIHGAYDTASYDGDYLVELADDDGYPMCSGAQLNIQPELFQEASDKELQTAIIQQTMLTNAPDHLKEAVIEEVKSKTWSQALDEADYLMNLEPEPMPDELPGMM